MVIVEGKHDATTVHDEAADHIKQRYDNEGPRHLAACVSTNDKINDIINWIIKKIVFEMSLQAADGSLCYYVGVNPIQSVIVHRLSVREGFLALNSPGKIRHVQREVRRNSVTPQEQPPPPLPRSLQECTDILTLPGVTIGLIFRKSLRAAPYWSLKLRKSRLGF
ncbi:hypothetical protein J6590_093742 [Homalodisca vitripennis]|nr:hypothetical protein J6590_093742 [Homalodisca vitripennis]